jgi:hypothetical protein
MDEISEQLLVPVDRVGNLIYLIRGKKVILDSDLADLYGVETRRLNEQVRRNIAKFPEDFMFQLNQTEFENLISQNATSRTNWGGRRKLPFAFTEHGTIMAANVLNSDLAVQMSVLVVRAFVKMREMLEAHTEILYKLQDIESKLLSHDDLLQYLLAAVDEMMNPAPPENPRKIGF